MSDSKPADGPKKISESMDLYASMPYFPYMDTRDLFAEVGPYGFLDGVPQQYMTRRDNRMAGELLPLYINWWQLKIIRDRSRQIARNNEFAISAINAHRNYVVGTGFTYTVQARYDGANLDLIKKTQDLVDLLVEHNRMPEIESEIIYRLHADGEAFLRFFAGSDGLLRIRFIEPELIRPPADDTTPNNSFGIKCDDDDIHDITGYWVIERPWFDLTPTLVPADQILHLKINSESNSKRGLPTIYAVESNLRAAEDVLQSMIALAKARSKIAVIRKVNDSPPDAVAELARTATDFTVSDPIQNRNTNISHMGYGSILTTTGNVGYEFPSLNVGSGDLVETLNANLRAIASRFGITETMMSADASNNNYASSLVAEAPAVKTFERMQRMLGQAIGERRTRPERSLVWNQITHAVNMGMLPRDVFEQVTIRAKGPSLVSRNRNEEASVAKQYYDMGLWSPQTITADSGKNYEEEQRNIAKSREESAKNPMLSNPNPGIEPPAMGDQSTDLPKQADGPDQVQDTALNGAQVTSLVDLATQVAQGALPLETAQAIASAAFPAVSKELIGQIFDPIEPNPAASGNISEAEKYSHIDFSPPEGVRKAAARGLELRKKHGRGGTAVGVARARTLSNGQKVTPETAKRMHSYFARHEVDKQGEGWGEDSAGYIAWLLWGGDAGKSWSAKLVKQIDAADKKEGIEIVGPTGTYNGAVPESEMDDKISDKIKILMDEGKPQQQAVAIALSMARRGEL